MPINYSLEPRKNFNGDDIKDAPNEPSTMDAFPDGAEQEHAKDCDINVMVKRVLNGQMVHGSNNQAIYGDDDLTTTALSHRIALQKSQEEMQAIAAEIENTELPEEEIKELQKNEFYKNLKFKVRKKEAKTNDDKTTNENASTIAQNPTPTPTPNKA